MSWMAKLYQTYEAGVHLDLQDADKLMPISHTLQNAHINIVIDGNGLFLRAEILEKTQIVLPATEKSAGRSSGESPHALADKIQYVAQDYAAFGGTKKAYFDGYLQQLTAWCESDFSHPKIRAVRQYVAKGEVVSDLVKHKILVVDEDNQLSTTWPEGEAEQPKIFKVLPKEKKRVEQGNALICWSVENQEPPAETWKDPELQDAWVQYDLKSSDKPGLCFVTGKMQPLAESHPAKLRHTGDKAKLISSNDLSGYTFRGRFTDGKKSIDKYGTQSVGISFEVTQKAHNALRWLISRQGFRNGDQAIVCWAVSGDPIPDPMDDVWACFDEPTEFLTLSEVPADTDTNISSNHEIDLGQSFAMALKKRMAGYHAERMSSDKIMVMAIDSATPGRMGVTYYQEFFPQDFIDRISQWHEDFAWYQRHKIARDVGKKKPESTTVWPISAPSPKAIWEAIYGTTINDSLKKNVVERLMPCILEKRAFPKDLVDKAVQKATNRVAYKSDEQWLWEKHLCIACALFKGYRKRDINNPKEYTMALDENNHSRDYLYGRLLAIAEKIEEMAMIVADEKPRSTQASRLMQRFADRPYTTWPSIVKGINPYQERLKGNIPPLAEAYKRLLDTVSDHFDVDAFKSPERLSGEYLLGYHSQRKWLRDHKLEKGVWIVKIPGEVKSTNE